MFASIEESPFQYIPLPQNARSYNEIYMDLKNCRQKQKICVRDKFARQRPHVEISPHLRFFLHVIGSLSKRCKTHGEFVVLINNIAAWEF